MRILYLVCGRNNYFRINNFLIKYKISKIWYLCSNKSIVKILLWGVMVMLWKSIWHNLLAYDFIAHNLTRNFQLLTIDEKSIDKSLTENILLSCISLQRYQAENNALAYVVVIGENSAFLETTKVTLQHQTNSQYPTAVYISEDTTYLIQSHIDICTFSKSNYFMHEYSQLSINHVMDLVSILIRTKNTPIIPFEIVDDQSVIELHYQAILDDHALLPSQKSDSFGKRLFNYVSLLEAAVLSRSSQTKIKVCIHVIRRNQELKQLHNFLNCNSIKFTKLLNNYYPENLHDDFLDWAISQQTSTNRCELRSSGRPSYDQLFLSALQMYSYTYSNLHQIDIVYVLH